MIKIGDVVKIQECDTCILQRTQFTGRTGIVHEINGTKHRIVLNGPYQKDWSDYRNMWFDIDNIQLHI